MSTDEVRVLVGAKPFMYGGYTAVVYSVRRGDGIGSISFNNVKVSVWKCRTAAEAENAVFGKSRSPSTTFQLNHADLTLLRHTPDPKKLDVAGWSGFSSDAARAATVRQLAADVYALINTRDIPEKRKRRWNRRK